MQHSILHYMLTNLLKIVMKLTNDGDLFNPVMLDIHLFNYEYWNSSITQTIGFYPSEGVSPVSPQTSGTWVDDLVAFDVSISINLNQSNFLALISNLEMGAHLFE